MHLCCSALKTEISNQENSVGGVVFEMIFCKILKSTRCLEIDDYHSSMCISFNFMVVDAFGTKIIGTKTLFSITPLQSAS